jgi:hypothetical protein
MHELLCGWYYLPHALHVFHAEKLEYQPIAPLAPHKQQLLVKLKISPFLGEYWILYLPQLVN